jgi:hypothetical protein
MAYLRQYNLQICYQFSFTVFSTPYLAQPAGIKIIKEFIFIQILSTARYVLRYHARCIFVQKFNNGYYLAHSSAPFEITNIISIIDSKPQSMM